jgi:hypothetical protein
MRKSKRRPATVWLDYGPAASDKLLRNISAAVAAGPSLWTASDEGRTIECLEPHGDGFRLREQVSLDGLFAALPGKARGDEADIESLAVEAGRLWVCGSHCHVRRKAKEADRIDTRFRDRASRCLLGAVELKKDGGDTARKGSALPFRGAGSLRAILRKNAYIAPFIDLPSKENGLDIEGLAVSGERLLLGLRGPLVDSIAIAVEFETARQGLIKRGKPVTHLLELGGLGIRDLTVMNREIAILAGPVSAANVPFKLFRWRPRRTDKIQRPDLLWEWPLGREHPEGICPLERHGKPGLLVVYDAPAEARIRGRRYRADWIALSPSERRRARKR